MPFTRHFSPSDVDIYRKVLGAPNLLRSRRGIALEPHLMSDSGTYEASGLLTASHGQTLINLRRIFRDVLTT